MKIQEISGMVVAFIFVLLLPFLNIYLGWWYLFVPIYLFFAIGFVWWIITMLFIVDIQKRKKVELDITTPYTVVLPVYNEEYGILNDTIRSIMVSKGNKELIISNDGSTFDETRKALIEMKQIYPEIKVLDFKENRGKKFAQCDAIIKAKNEYIISVDSDTVFNNDCFLKLVNPLKDNKIGITNANISPLNNKDNLLTKMQEFQMYSAFNIGRRTLGGFGSMNCASGIAMAFRKKDYLDLKETYLGKRPFGFDCKFGEDRFLTNLILKKKKEVIMVEDAYAKSIVPYTIKKYLKQQLRWKISGFIESIHAMSFSWKNNPLLFFYSLFTLLLPLFCISLIVCFIMISLIYQDYVGILYFILATTMATFVRDLVIIIERKDLMKFIIPFTIMNLFTLMWLNIIALFRLNEQKWITR